MLQGNNLIQGMNPMTLYQLFIENEEKAVQGNCAQVSGDVCGCGGGSRK